jgi:ABC-type lipoprotein export system ATPase subunit
LDSETAAAISELLHALTARGTTIVTVTHDRAMAAGAHRVITLQDGKVQAAS